MYECEGLRQLPNGLRVRCGKCPPCKAQKAWKKAARIRLESSDHAGERCWYVTLTFRGTPPSDAVGYQSVQRWLKRLRKAHKVRFICAPELGPLHQRLHYHTVLWSQDRIKYRDFPKWKHGYTRLKIGNPANVGYALKYINKQEGKIRASKHLGVDRVRRVSDLDSVRAVLDSFPGSYIRRIGRDFVLRELSEPYVRPCASTFVDSEAQELAKMSTIELKANSVPIGTSEGHENWPSSPFYQSRMERRKRDQQVE